MKCRNKIDAITRSPTLTNSEGTWQSWQKGDSSKMTVNRILAKGELVATQQSVSGERLVMYRRTTSASAALCHILYPVSGDLWGEYQVRVEEFVFGERDQPCLQ